MKNFKRGVRGPFPRAGMVRSKEVLADHCLCARHCGVFSIGEIMNGDVPSAESPPSLKAPQVGKGWARRWLAKYGDRVKKYHARGLERKRANAANPDNIAHWFKLLGDVLTREGFAPDMIFGMDETCAAGDTGQSEIVLGAPGKNIQHSQRPINRESATLMVTVSANGVVYKPYCIFKGVKKMASWAENNPLDAM
jgi:hypothetical protein